MPIADGKTAPPRIRFNMGCGQRKLAGHVNVDAQAACAPDQVVDLEQTPWPWADSCAEEVRFIHALEHMGADPKVFLAMMQELYRIAAPDCRILVKVPHPRHDNFISDPTHVRAITPDTWRLLDAKLNAEVEAGGGSNTPLARYLGVDFELASHSVTLDEPYWSQYRSGEVTHAELERLLKERNNVAREFTFELRARKPSRAG